MSVIPSLSEGSGGEGGAPPAHTGPSLTLGMTAGKETACKHS
jgi:hypothetical protein